MNNVERVRRNVIVPRNRMLRMRMRASRWWVNIYRDAAMQKALEEARTRSFFATFIYVISEFYQISRAPRRKLRGG